MNDYKHLDFKSLLLFLSIYYASVGFNFGIGNNVEELPVIFQRAGIYDFTNDPFVSAAIERFNVTTIYTFGLAQIAKITGSSGLKHVFFLLHILCLSGIFLAFRALLRLITDSVASKYFILIALLVLLFGDRFLQWMPNVRTLFPNILDPEFVVLPLLFWAIYHFLLKQHNYSAVLLFFSVLIHPLYTLPLAGSFMVIEIFFLLQQSFDVKYFKSLLIYLLSVIPFGLVLWYFSHQTVLSEFNPSLIHEIIRAPHHLVIPSLLSSDRLSYIRFFEMTLFFSLMAMVLYYFKNIWSLFYIQNKAITPLRTQAISRLYMILACLLFYLLSSSAVSSFVRIDLLVALTPYRMGIIIIAISFILLSGAVSELIKDKGVNSRYDYLFTIGIIVFTSIALFKYGKTTPMEQEQELAVEWINSHTEANSFWLNYADIDVRTHCGRSDFFQFKTIPVYEDAQIDWYKRLCVYYDISEAGWLDYKSVRNHIKSECTTIDIGKVLKALKDSNLDYLLIDNKQKMRLLGLPGSRVYRNLQFEIYDLNHLR